MDKDKKTAVKKGEFPFAVNESLVSMVLGAVVVVLIGLIAYNFFKSQRNTAVNTSTDQTTQEAKQGELGESGNSANLPTTHTVKAGENLWKISEQYYKSGYNFVDIAKANKLANYNKIETGQILTIPKVEVKQPLTVNGGSNLAVAAKRIEGNKYSVVKGDDLWKISVRAYADGYKWVEIAKANKLTNPNLIHPGNELIIPR